MPGSRAGTVTVNIEWDPRALQQLKAAAAGALERTAVDVLTDIRHSQVVPKDTGALEESGFVYIMGLAASIIFDTPYARRLYWHPEYNFRQDKNPDAQGLWMDMYLPGGEKEDFIPNTFAAHYKALSKGLIT